MSNMFGNLNTHDVAKSEDVVFGGGFIKDTGVYPFTVKQAWGIKSTHGAMGVHLELLLGDGSTYREDVYVTNRAGDPFYTKAGSDKKLPLPGYITINELCLVLTGKGLAELPQETKKVKIRDKDTQTDVPTDVPVIVDLLGLEGKVAILKTRENKMQKNDATQKWDVPTNEERFTNSIEKFYGTDDRTANEKAGEGQAAHQQKWLDVNNGKTRDKFKEVKGAPKSGAPSTKGAAGSNSTDLFND